MAFQYSPLSLFLGAAAVFLATFTYFAWRRRHIPGVIWILVIFACATAWSAASALALADSGMAMTLAMSLVSGPAGMVIPVSFLLFALWYTEHDSRPSRLFLALLFVIPVMAEVLLATNGLHHLYYAGLVPVSGPRGTVIWEFIRGPLSWVCTSYPIVLTMTALLLFILRYRTVGTLFRTQILLILAAGLVPFCATLLFFLDLGPEPGFDWTPVTFVISGFALIAATLNFELFSLQPLTYSLLVRTMKDGAVATNGGGRITLINPACSAILGVSGDEVVGTSLAACAPGLGRFVDGDNGAGGEGSEITLPVHGAPRIFEVQAVPIPAEDGTSGGRILTFRDVTDRKNAETAFQSANRKLSLLSGIVRHDVKNKLTALFMYLELATEPGSREAQQQDLLKVRESADGIRTLIDFTQEYQELGVAAPVWQNAGAVLTDASRLLDCSCIRIADESGGAEVLADRLFQRVMYNLLDNALRYARGMTQLTLRSATEGETLILFIEDNGPGVSADEKERIFERGFGHNTGLGLFLVREILGITGITIRETGEPGKGARFEIRVPPGKYRFPDQESG